MGRIIQCVQPLCGRSTDDFYDVPFTIAAQTAGAQPGPTCAPCYEDLVRRQTRDLCDHLSGETLLREIRE